MVLHQGSLLPGDHVYQIGDTVSWHFAPGIVVASFFASLIGCILTVELLHRKRLGNSWSSRAQLLACATAFGLIGIWCMHFIGQRSIVLGQGQENLQLTYSPGFTFLSCVLPVIGLSIAFYIAELHIRNVVVRRCLDISTGFFAGLSIVGMHYCGNLGTANYALDFAPRFIIASCIIAIGDCVLALMLFFYFKEQWINVLWKRLLCALMLAVAVCGMHYTASIGSAYRLTSLNVAGSQRNTAVIVAGVLCCGAAMVVFAIIGYTAMRKRQLADKATQVNLVCAYFDKEGNILVTNEGVLPSQKIAKRFSLQRMDEEFNTAHPTFHWIWKVTHDWDAISDMIPRMRSHIIRLDPSASSEKRPGSSFSHGSSFYEASFWDETLLFREGFCVASADIADRLNVKLDQLGIMYDKIIGTGVMPKGTSAKRLARKDAASIASNSAYERGQVLYFTRVLSPDDTAHFCDSGYRLAPPSRVEPMIARTMQIPIQFVASNIKSLQDYAIEVHQPAIVKSGTYLTCFAALGRLTKHFDVLVSRTQNSQLPDVRLSAEHLNKTQLGFLKQYDGWSAGAMVADLKQKHARDRDAETIDRGFMLVLIDCLSLLSNQISEEWFNDLIFNARPIVAHYGRAKSPATAMILGLTKLLDIHQSVVKQPKRLTFVPLDFFRVCSAFYPGCPDRTKFRAQIHTELSPILIRPIVVTTTAPDEKPLEQGGRFKRSAQVMVRKLSRTTQDDASSVREDSCSERNLFEADSAHAARAFNGSTSTEATAVANASSDARDGGRLTVPGSPSPSRGGNEIAINWGGILATKDTFIVAHDASPDQRASFEMRPFGTVFSANVVSDGGRIDEKTFADALYEQAKARGVIQPGEWSHPDSLA